MLFFSSEIKVLAPSDREAWWLTGKLFELGRRVISAWWEDRDRREQLRSVCSGVPRTYVQSPLEFEVPNRVRTVYDGLRAGCWWARWLENPEEAREG